MEIRVLRCSKMTHKSYARERMQNTAVCMMDTNSRMMSGMHSYKYLSLCCRDMSQETAGLLISSEMTQSEPFKEAVHLPTLCIQNEGFCIL